MDKKPVVRVLPSEAICGFVGWITTRKEVVVVSRKHDCSDIVRLVEEFCDAQGYEPPRNRIFPKNIVPFIEKSVKKLSRKETKKIRLKASDLF